MTRAVKISIFSGIGLILATTGWYLYKQSKLLQSLCYEFVNMNYANVPGEPYSNVTARVRFINYADVPLHIKSYSVEAFIDNQKVANINSSQHYTIPSKGMTAIDFVAQTNTGDVVSQLITTVLEELIDKKTSYFKIKGKATVKMGWVTVSNYPIDLSWTSDEVITSVKGEGENCPKIA